MIPKEFKNTIEQKKEYDDYMTQFEYDEIPEEFAHLPPLEVQEKEYEASDEYKLKEQIKQSFSDEYAKLTEINSYFLGCVFKSYESTYKSRLVAFQKKYIDAKEHNFIYDELNAIIFFELPNYIDDGLNKSISYSLERTKEYLINRLEELSFNVVFTVNDNGLETLSIKNNQKDLSIKKMDKPKLEWKGTETDLIELGKALIVAKYINSDITQKDFLKSLMDFFNFNVPNPKKLLQNIRNRKENQTILINRLEQKLRDWQSQYG